MEKRIIVTVTQDGQTVIEAVGFKGKSCTKATEALERALGTVKKRRPKPEFYQTNENQQKASL